jgi:serine/tyrosine/threonine adenylyltransferase
MRFPFDNSYARLPEAFFARVNPTPVSAPKLIAFNEDLAGELGLDVEAFDGEAGAAIFSGNRVPEGADPIAMAYSGHQFGGFSPQLGDGRTILLGEVVNRDGARRDIQLKGSGPTPFSRRGDGRSALGPVLREYLVSEAMAALGIPTTRALAAVWSGDRVFREEAEPGGIFTRVAASHLRIGTVQYFAARQDFGNLKTLVDYAMDRHYPESNEAENRALALLNGVMQRQAELIARWMQVGFIHGVMNTDNMSLSGETIDFGPCAFLDHYDPAKRFSFIDQNGRYAFGNQPVIAHWNLTRLAEALLPLLADTDEEAIEIAQNALAIFPDLFRDAYLKRFSEKIGIPNGDERDGDIIEGLLLQMQEARADFTLTFRYLNTLAGGGSEESFLAQFSNAVSASGWLDSWKAHLTSREQSLEAAAVLMRQTNPVFIPRNHRIEEVIEAGKQGNFEPFHQLHRILQRPFAEQPESAEYESSPKPEEVVCATFCGT